MHYTSEYVISIIRRQSEPQLEADVERRRMMLERGAENHAEARLPRVGLSDRLRGRMLGAGSNPAHQ